MDSINESGDAAPLQSTVSDTQERLTDKQLHAALALSKVSNNVNHVFLAAETAKLREKYQELNVVLSDQVTRISEKREENDEARIVDLQQKLKEISQTFEKVQCGKELAADAQLLETASKLGFLCVEGLQRSATGRVFNGPLFAKNLLRFIRKKENDEDNCQDEEEEMDSWCRFTAANYCKIIRPVPPLITLRPVLTVDKDYVRPKKSRTRSKVEKVDVVQLNALNSEGTTTDGKANLTRQLDNVYSCLKRQLRNANVEQIGFYQFCLDPNDFARSVENIFYVSFLIKEMRVKITYSGTDFPQISCVSASEREKFHADDRTRARTNQGVVSISYPQWQVLCKLPELLLHQFTLLAEESSRRLSNVYSGHLQHPTFHFHSRHTNESAFTRSSVQST